MPAESFLRHDNSGLRAYLGGRRASGLWRPTENSPYAHGNDSLIRFSPSRPPSVTRGRLPDRTFCGAPQRLSDLAVP